MRSIVLSNGELCVALDEHARVRDIYFPHVGFEDHVRGHYMHRVGVWVDGTLSWLGDEGWQITVASEEDALASSVSALNSKLGVELSCTDAVYNERPVFLRRIAIKNMHDKNRVIKLYIAHQFEIFKSHGSDTAYFDPETYSVIHYKGSRVFLISAILDGVHFEDYACGRANFQGKEGSHKDAEDGMLSKNAIEHGPADSIIGLYGQYARGQSRTAYYWVAAARSIGEAVELSAYIHAKKPEHMLRTVVKFWHAWVGAYPWGSHGLEQAHMRLFKQSLLYVRAHVDSGGGIIASVDSDMLQHGLDTYCYVWPRDASYAAIALDRAGDSNVAKRFFEFCRTTISPDGYFLHKFLPDGSLGSSWHPWIVQGKRQLPIQEDATALVLVAFREHYLHTRDLEFLEEMYNPLIEKAADFLVRYRDEKTGLPQPTYDLWEERRGCATYTAASVYGGLMAAAELSALLGKDEHEKHYRDAAIEVQAAIMKHLWDEDRGVFLKMVSDGGARDTTIDMSSAYGVLAFGVLAPNDPKLKRAFENSVRALSRGVRIGGIARYEGDEYYRTAGDAAGNPWIITTLWYAEYLIASAKNDHDLDRVRDIFTWVCGRAAASGVLPEQMNAQTGEPVSATPLMWSHAQYAIAILKYLDKLEELGVCPECNPAP